MKTRVYVAGSYSAPTLVEALDNIRRGQRKATELLLKGYVPFCPWLDYQFQLQLREDEALTKKHYQDYSMEWLRASHVMLVMPHSERSGGTQKEIEESKRLGIPVYFDEALFYKEIKPVRRTDNGE